MMDKQKGYILVVVLIMTFFMSMIIAATFTVAMRYYHLTREEIMMCVDLIPTAWA